MRPPIPIPEHRLVELKVFRKNKWPGLEFQRFLCVSLRAEHNLLPKEIAKVLGWHVDTVRSTQRDFIARGIEALVDVKRGGRRYQLMTLEEEKDFLAAFIDRAESATMLVIQEIKEALETRLGRTVHKTTVCRMLWRHGWRKIKPRTQHLKQKKEAIEAFKKGASLTG